jgi:hypothetical protein
MTIVEHSSISPLRNMSPRTRHESFTVHGPSSAIYACAVVARRLVRRYVGHDPGALAEIHAQLDRNHLLLSGRVEARDAGTIRILRSVEHLLDRLEATTFAPLVVDRSGLRRSPVEMAPDRPDAPIDGVAAARAMAMPSTDLRPLSEVLATEVAPLVVPTLSPSRRGKSHWRWPAPARDARSLRADSVRVRVTWDEDGKASITALDMFMPPWWEGETRGVRDRLHQAAWRVANEVSRCVPSLQVPPALPIRLRPTSVLEARAAIVRAGRVEHDGIGGGFPLGLFGCSPAHPSRAGWALARSLARRAVTVFGADDAVVRVGIDAGETMYRVEDLRVEGASISSAALVDGIDLGYRAAKVAGSDLSEGSPAIARDLPSQLDISEHEA